MTEGNVIIEVMLDYELFKYYENVFVNWNKTQNIEINNFKK